jgi:hypothetical protein
MDAAIFREAITNQSDDAGLTDPFAPDTFERQICRKVGGRGARPGQNRGFRVTAINPTLGLTLYCWRIRLDH